MTLDDVLKRVAEISAELARYDETTAASSEADRIRVEMATLLPQLAETTRLARVGLAFALGMLRAGNVDAHNAAIFVLAGTLDAMEPK